MKNNHIVLLSMGALMFHFCDLAAAWQPDQDKIKAREQQIATLKKSDKKQDAQSCVRLAKLMLNGRTKEQQLTAQENKELKLLLVKAVKLGSSEAAWMILDLGFERYIPGFDEDRQLKLFCQNDFVPALLLASRMAYGISAEERNACRQRVEELLIPKAEKGDGEAALQLANYYECLKDVPEPLVIKYFQLAAQSDNSEACYRLGLAYVNGQVVGKDVQRAEEYFKKALPHFSQLAAEGNYRGLKVMGQCYRHGYGVKACKLTALDYFWYALGPHAQLLGNITDESYMGGDLDDEKLFLIFFERCLNNVGFNNAARLYEMLINRIAGMNFNGNDRIGALVERLHNNENKLDYMNLEFEKLYEPLLNYYAAQGNKPKVAKFRGKMLKFYSRWVQLEAPEASIKCAEIYMKDLPGIAPDYRKAIACLRKAGTLEALQRIAPIYKDKLGDEAGELRAHADFFVKFHDKVLDQFQVLVAQYLENKQQQKAVALLEAVLFDLLKDDTCVAILKLPYERDIAEKVQAYLQFCNNLSDQLEGLYLQQEQHAKATALWKHMLDGLQDAEAAVKLSNYYVSGQWVKADEKLSQKYAIIAESLKVEGGSAAECYLYGLGFERDAAKALKVLQRERALQRDSNRLEFLYLMMQVEPQLAKQENKLDEWNLNSSINSLLAEEQDANVLGYFYNYYVSVSDLYQATQILTSSAASKLPQGKLLLAEHLLQPHMEYSDTQQGLEKLREAANANYAPAMYRLGLEYLSGQHLNKDLNESWSLLRGAYDKGECLAGGALCEAYLKGEGVPCDPQQAAELMAKVLPQLQQLAAERRSEPEFRHQRRPVQAMLELARIYQQGIGVAVDAAQARKWYLQAADSGDARAMFECCVYLQACGKKDFPKAAALLRAAAGKNYTPALVLMAQQLEQGKYMPKDFKAAYKAYSAAIELRHVPSYFKVADYCLNGRGVARNQHRAAACYYWLYKNCDNKEAGKLLANCYLKGIGVAKDEQHGRLLLKQLAEKGQAKE